MLINGNARVFVDNSYTLIGIFKLGYMMSKFQNAELQKYYQDISQQSLLELFSSDPKRAERFTIKADGVYFDFSKNNINQDILDTLIKVADESNLKEKINAMFSGVKINNTEGRAVLHTALRSTKESICVDGINVMPEINRVKTQMETFCHAVHNGVHLGFTGKKITTIVNIGIGGSDLGPVLISQALKPYCISGMEIYFISSVDGYMLQDVLKCIDPETTLFVIASKTFTTQETMTNANSARKWFIDKTNSSDAIAKHFIALSTNSVAVKDFGINLDNMFAFWDFVGGRYSSWSAIGLSVALYIGWDNFQLFLSGAHAMDEHFVNEDFSKNIPVILGLLGIWYVNYYDYRSLVISPYNTRLARFPAYVQQLEMESNGKSTNLSGERITYQTCPSIWGDSGINGQHAYYQLLHQGSQIIPMDIIIAASDKFSDKKHNNILWSNAIAQAEAFMCGKTYNEAKEELLVAGMSDSKASEIAKHKIFDGNRPSNMLIIPEINPFYLGYLIALYEHKTFVQGALWDVNSFDQMGVELGKKLAKTVLEDIDSKQITKHDSSTSAIIQYYLQSSIET